MTCIDILKRVKEYLRLVVSDALKFSAGSYCLSALQIEIMIFILDEFLK